MVLRSSSGSLPEAASLNNTGSFVDAVMASDSRSPQPLHNFTLPDDLKWSFNPSPHRFRKPMLADSPSPQRTDEEVSSERKSNKILLRLSNKSKAYDEVTAAEPLDLSVNGEDQHQTSVGDGDGDGDGSDGEEAAPKTWNLRPRKPLVKKQPNVVASVPKGGRGEAQVKQSQGQSRAMVNNGNKKKKKKEKEDKQKLYVSLSRQEIEEDIFAMTGSKPSRRPKKRTKAVQKLVDNLFPGLWSYTISPDAYRVPDPPLKN